MKAALARPPRRAFPDVSEQPTHEVVVPLYYEVRDSGFTDFLLVLRYDGAYRFEAPFDDGVRFVHGLRDPGFALFTRRQTPWAVALGDVSFVHVRHSEHF